MASTMSFSRAFSTRRNKPEFEISAPLYIGRAASQRGGKPVIRKQISSPMALVSTSNNQVHSAQHIAGTSPIEIRHVSNGSTSTSSSDESDASTASVHSHETVTDASSIDDSPISAELEPNHLTSYFKPAVDTHAHSLSKSFSVRSRPSLDYPSLEYPVSIPERAPSHSKKAHEGVHRKNSIKRMLSPPPSRDRDIARSSTEIFNQRSGFVESPRENPFGKEIAQLDQVAEEYGQVVRNAEADADAMHMDSRGLAHYSASDYMFEIQGLIHEMFREDDLNLGNFF